MKPPHVAVALTSLSPEDELRDRQRACVDSWRNAGCKVVAFQTHSELALIGTLGWPGVEFVPVDGPLAWDRRFVLVSTLARWATTYAYTAEALPVLFINADCALECTPERLAALALEAGDGLCCLVRHETDGSRFAGGIDGLLMAAKSAALVPSSDVMVLGRPHWDTVVATRFLDGGKALCSPSFRIMGHETHPVRWSPEDMGRASAEAARLLGHLPPFSAIANRMRHIGPDMKVAAPVETRSSSLIADEEAFGAVRMSRGY